MFVDSFLQNVVLLCFLKGESDVCGSFTLICFSEQSLSTAFTVFIILYYAIFQNYVLNLQMVHRCPDISDCSLYY